VEILIIHLPLLLLGGSTRPYSTLLSVCFIRWHYYYYYFPRNENCFPPAPIAQSRHPAAATANAAVVAAVDGCIILVSVRMVK
jgi:hypothetical protein